MTAPPPDDSNPTERERSAAEIDAQFAAIVSTMRGSMSWDLVDGPADDPASDSDDAAQRARDRERRRELRREQRAQEVAEFEAAQADAKAELQADDAHYEPPDPPPVPRPRRRTVVALLFMAVGVLLLVRPTLLQVTPDAVLVLAMLGLTGGFAMLVWGLRPRAADPDDSEGWDDGARL